MSTWITLKNWKLATVLFMLCVPSVWAQQEEKELQKAKKESQKMLQEAEENLGENDFASAEASYRKAVSKNPANTTAKYNMANMYYGKEKPSEATERYKQAAEVADSKEGKHKVFHNLGNSFMDQKKYEPAIEAYKNALRNDPLDEETRYNLALAKKMLEKQKQDGGGDDKKDQDQDKKDKDKDKENQDKKEGDKGDKDKNDGENKEDKGDENKDDKQQNPEKPDDKGDPKDQKDNKEQGKDPQQQQPQPGQLSPQQIKNLLEAMNNEEKKVQDKINAEKTKGAKTRNEKDW